MYVKIIPDRVLLVRGYFIIFPLRRAPPPLKTPVTVTLEHSDRVSFLTNKQNLFKMQKATSKLVASILYHFTHAYTLYLYPKTIAPCIFFYMRKHPAVIQHFNAKHQYNCYIPLRLFHLPSQADNQPIH